ncbi:extracellular solute-binding protein [Microbacterium sp. NPDC089698]|uniref:extracellular solute-binding protein n=1 Tax=Microbacterium sp. NPDC089698 TaxID=3364200 RepID=UPI00380FC36C
MKKRVLSIPLGLAAAAVALAACAPVSSTGAPASSAGATSLTVFISGDTNVQDLWEKGIIPAYESAHPGASVRTTIDLHGEHDQQTVAKLVTATKAGDAPGYDLVDAGFVTGSATEAGTLLDIDGKVSGLSDVPAATVKAGKGTGIPYRASSVLLAYDSTKVQTPPKTLDELLAWIQANPGKFAYNSPATGGSGGAFVTTVLDSYLSDAEQQALRTGHDTAAEAGWAKGFDRLKQLGSSMYQSGVYPNGNTQVIDLLGTGAISMAPVWSDQIMTSVKNGLIPKTVKYTQISGPSFTGSASYLGIPKTSKNTAGAIDLVNFVLSPAGQRIIAEKISGYPVIDVKKLPEETAKTFADADPSALRPSYFAEVSGDMADQWDSRVP